MSTESRWRSASGWRSAVARGAWAFACAAWLWTLGCAPPADESANDARAPREAESPSAAEERSSPESAESPESPGSPERGPTIIFLGDSLTAGYGLDEEEAFPHRVDEALASAADGPSPRVVNAGVSGDTTAGGLRRLDWLLRQDPDVLVVALGGNDGLRGLDPASTEENLRQIVVRAREHGARVLLAGMLIPPNYGPEYTEAFAAIFPRLAEELDVPLIPFLLDGVAGDPKLNQPDGIHPTAEGQALLADTVLAHLQPILEELASEAPDGPSES